MSKSVKFTQEESDLMYEEYEREVSKYEKMSSYSIDEQIEKTRAELIPLRKKLSFLRAAERRQASYR